ncbi:hypothetical protein ACS0TY_001725 [Phlomoides rotata]
MNGHQNCSFHQCHLHLVEKIRRPPTSRRVEPEEKASKKSKKGRVVKMRRRQTSIKACTQVVDGELVQVDVPEPEQENVPEHIPEPVPTR